MGKIDEKIPHVLLKRNPRNEIKPYHIEPQEKYLSRPPLNSYLKLFGVYSSAREAYEAMMDDNKKEIEKRKKQQKKATTKENC